MKNKRKGFLNGILSDDTTNFSSNCLYFEKGLTKKAPNLNSTKSFGAPTK